MYDVSYTKFFMHMEVLSQLQKIKIKSRDRPNNKNRLVFGKKK